MQIGFSAKSNAFYFLEEEAAYSENGTWQVDITPVSLKVWQNFAGTPPDGKQRGAGKEGMPAWVDIPEHDDRTIEVNQAIKNALLERAETEIRMLTVVQDVYGLNEKETLKLGAWKKHLADVYRMNASVKEKMDWPDAPETR